MTALLICAWVASWCGILMCVVCGVVLERHQKQATYLCLILGLALIAAALYLAWRAGGAG